jgi:hypothetical protein
MGFFNIFPQLASIGFDWFRSPKTSYTVRPRQKLEWIPALEAKSLRSQRTNAMSSLPHRGQDHPFEKAEKTREEASTIFRRGLVVTEMQFFHPFF